MDAEKSAIESKPQDINKIRQQWMVHEDGGLAYRMQENEFTDHFSHNRDVRRTVSSDIKVSKVVQSEEELRLQQERMHELEKLRRVAEEDEKMARKMMLQEQSEFIQQRTVEETDEEVARKLQLKEAEKLEKYKAWKSQRQLDREQAQVEYAAVQKKRNSGAEENAYSVEPTASQDRLVRPDGKLEDRGDFSDLYALPSDTSEQERRRIQEEQDEEIARLLQEQEHKRGGSVAKDQMKAQELQDAEVAKLVHEQERQRHREAILRRRMRKDLNAQQQNAENQALETGVSAMRLSSRDSPSPISRHSLPAPNESSFFMPTPSLISASQPHETPGVKPEKPPPPKLSPTGQLPSYDSALRAKQSRRREPASKERDPPVSLIDDDVPPSFPAPIPTNVPSNRSSSEQSASPDLHNNTEDGEVYDPEYMKPRELSRSPDRKSHTNSNLPPTPDMPQRNDSFLNALLAGDNKPGQRPKDPYSQVERRPHQRQSIPAAPPMPASAKMCQPINRSSAIMAAEAIASGQVEEDTRTSNQHQKHKQLQGMLSSPIVKQGPDIRNLRGGKRGASMPGHNKRNQHTGKKDNCKQQ